MSEAELAIKFINHFNEGYEVFKEVPCGHGIIDFVAKQEKILIAVEVKKSLTFEVVAQAINNLYYCHYSYIAVPSASRGCRDFAYRICKQNGIGVLCSDVYGIREDVKPKFFRNKEKNFYKKIVLKEYMKQSVAGSQHNRVTAFKNTVNEIVAHLSRNNGMDKINNVLNKVDFHYSSLSAAKATLSSWCHKGIIKEFKSEKGFFVLNEVI